MLLAWLLSFCLLRLEVRLLCTSSLLCLLSIVLLSPLSPLHSTCLDSNFSSFLLPFLLFLFFSYLPVYLISFAPSYSVPSLSPSEVLGIALVMTFYGMTAGLAVGVFNAALAFTLQVNTALPCPTLPYNSCSAKQCSAVQCSAVQCSAR